MLMFFFCFLGGSIAMKGEGLRLARLALLLLQATVVLSEYLFTIIQKG